MSKRVNHWMKQAVAFLLIVVMSVPSIALGADFVTAEELAWQQ